MVEGVGERLRRARESAGLSQARTALKAGVSVAVLRNIERGTIYTKAGQQPYHSSAATLAKLAVAVGLDPEDLVRAAGLDESRIPWRVIEEQRAGGFTIAVVAADGPVDEEALLERVREALRQAKEGG